MNNYQQSRGPSNKFMNIGHRIVTTLVSIIETRIRLAVVELEAEKVNLIHMLIIIGMTMLFTAFGLMTLIILIIWSVNKQYQIITIAIVTSVMFTLALIFGFWTLAKSRRSTLFSATRKELSKDRQLLEDN